jgi:hypothetical protein
MRIFMKHLITAGLAVLAYHGSASARPKVMAPGVRAAVACVQAAIRAGDQKASLECVSYSDLRANFTKALWLEVAGRQPPTPAEIKDDWNLKAQAQFIDLSTESFCDNVTALNRLLHGGAAADAAADRDVFAGAKLESIDAHRAVFLLTGDDGQPVRASFVLLAKRWKLSEVLLHILTKDVPA